MKQSGTRNATSFSPTEVVLLRKLGGNEVSSGYVSQTRRQTTSFSPTEVVVHKLNYLINNYFFIYLLLNFIYHEKEVSI
jgi:hypothetical protein